MDDIGQVNKSTHSGYRVDLFMPILKSAEGKYIAVLSDDSVDRDEEKCSKGCIEKFNQEEDYLAGLINHENDIMNLVCEWTNRKVMEIDGHTAYIAEPKFYKSNPKAQIIKGMLDEGAKPGISIGARVKNYDEINGMRVFTELELLEASFVAIPSNRHGRAMAVAKSYHKKYIIKSEENKVEKEFTQKDVDSALQKKVDELNVEFNKKLEAKDAEISELSKNLKDSKEDLEKVQKEMEEAKKSSKEKIAELDKSLEDAKKAAIEKQKFADQGGDNNKNAEDIEKSFSEGKLPIMRG